MKILITGTSQGIGKAIAEHFLEMGHKVIGIDRQEPSIFHSMYFHHKCDISDYKSLPEIDEVEILINNAGTQNENDIDINLSPDGARTIRYWFPAGVIDSDVQKNRMVMENVAQIQWIPIFSNNGWFGQSFPAYISFPGGPDLAELLGL